MAVCEICGKRRMVGNNVSHANNRTKRIFKPNIQKLRVTLPNGTRKRIYICTKCLKAGKVQR